MVHCATALAQARAKLAGLGSGQVLLAPAFVRGTDTLRTQSPPGQRVSNAVTLTLSNPARRNALSGQMMVQLADHVDKLVSDIQYEDTTCVVVRGEGGFFCSGADLTSASQDLQSSQDGMDMCILMQSTLHKLRSLPLVSLAEIRGGAVGGGTELALACDIRIVEDDAVFQMVHASMGLSPG
jgi:enoyl-CoA hydratase/carnithine racemase